MSFGQFAFYWTVCFVGFKSLWSLMWIALARLDRKVQGERRARHIHNDL